MFALAACSGQSNEAPKAAPGASEAAVQTASPAVAENAASNAASVASASAASVVVADSNASPKDQELLKRVQGIFKPLPRAEEMHKLRLFSEERVKLDHQLWYEPRLSKGNTVSCNSCHNLATAGVNNLLTSQGHKGQFGGRNSQTALNAPCLAVCPNRHEPCPSCRFPHHWNHSPTINNSH